MKTLQGLLRYVPAEQPAHTIHLLICPVSDQLLFVDVKCSDLGPSLLCSFNQRLRHGCFMCRPFEKPYQEPTRNYPLCSTVSDTDADRMLVGVWQLVWASRGLLQKWGWGSRGGSRCTGRPAAGVDICVELISHAPLMQKPFNGFQHQAPRDSLWQALRSALHKDAGVGV